MTICSLVSCLFYVKGFSRRNRRFEAKETKQKFVLEMFFIGRHYRKSKREKRKRIDFYWRHIIRQALYFLCQRIIRWQTFALQNSKFVVENKSSVYGEFDFTVLQFFFYSRRGEEKQNSTSIFWPQAKSWYFFHRISDDFYKPRTKSIPTFSFRFNHGRYLIQGKTSFVRLFSFH